MGTPIENNTTELQSLLEMANALPAAVEDAVLYSEQSLSDSQKAQARENIGAVSEAELEANTYTHPTYTAKSSGLYKITVDNTGHVSGTTAVEKSDITTLGIPAQDTTYTLPAAGTSLGGVKSGGDVTISNGTITVNDDSHNHTISNVDDLQTTLNGKAPTSHASTATTYGAGSSSNYGHVKLSASTSSTSGVSGGIAATPSAVKAAYDLANSKGAGTITAVQANGTNVATSGTANIPAASTSAYGVTKLSSATNSTSTTLAATASAVKSAYDLANNALPKAGGTMTGVLTAQNNTSYTTKQARNIFLIADGASLPSGSNGDICLVYTP